MNAEFHPPFEWFMYIDESTKLGGKGLMTYLTKKKINFFVTTDGETNRMGLLPKRR